MGPHQRAPLQHFSYVAGVLQNCTGCQIPALMSYTKWVKGGSYYHLSIIKQGAIGFCQHLFYAEQPLPDVVQPSISAMESYQCSFEQGQKQLNQVRGNPAASPRELADAIKNLKKWLYRYEEYLDILIPVLGIRLMPPLWWQKRRLRRQRKGMKPKQGASGDSPRIPASWSDRVEEEEGTYRPLKRKKQEKGLGSGYSGPLPSFPLRSETLQKESTQRLQEAAAKQHTASSLMVHAIMAS